MEKNTLTRLKIIEVLHFKMGFSKTECSEILDSIFEEMVTALETEGEFKASKFGTFKVKSKKARIGRNPKTKEKALISARNVISFIPSSILKEKVNNDTES